MARIRRMALIGGVLGGWLVLGAIVGCQQPRESREVEPRPTRTDRGAPGDPVTSADAARAQAALERNQQEMSGERRPVDPVRSRPVDQPRVGQRR